MEIQRLTSGFVAGPRSGCRAHGARRRRRMWLLCLLAGWPCGCWAARKGRPWLPRYLSCRSRCVVYLMCLVHRLKPSVCVQLIEESFEAVMAKEPERQAKLAAEREEADRAKRQAELRRQAEERKRQEDRRKQMKAEAARDEQRRAERRREQERRSTHHRDHNRRSHERDRHRERDWRHDDRRRRDGSKSREGSEKPKLEARPEPEAQKPVDKSRTPGESPARAPKRAKHAHPTRRRSDVCWNLQQLKRLARRMARTRTLCPAAHRRNTRHPSAAAPNLWPRKRSRRNSRRLPHHQRRMRASPRPSASRRTHLCQAIVVVMQLETRH